MNVQFAWRALLVSRFTLLLRRSLLAFTYSRSFWSISVSSLRDTLRLTSDPTDVLNQLEIIIVLVLSVKIFTAFIEPDLEHFSDSHLVFKFYLFLALLHEVFLPKRSETKLADDRLGTGSEKATLTIPAADEFTGDGRKLRSTSARFRWSKLGRSGRMQR